MTVIAVEVVEASPIIVEVQESIAGTYTHPDTHPPSIIVQDEDNRFATDAEKTDWNAAKSHADALHAPTDADNTAAHETSHADVVVDGDFASNGLLKRTAAGVYGIQADNSTNWDTAYTHSQTAHAPAAAQKNSDMLKSEVEAVLTGEITTHSHAVDHAHSNKAQLDLVSDGDHDVRTDNPHSVTTSQIGAEPADADIAKTDVAQSWTAQQTFKELKDTVYNLTGVSIDPANGSIQYKTLGENTTFTDALEAGQAVTLMIDDGDAYTVTWPTISWVGGSAPTLETTGYNIVELWKVGSTLYGAWVGVA